MKRRFISALTACLLFGGCLLPRQAYAEDEVFMLTPLYTPIKQTDSVCKVSVAAGVEFTLSVYQHSPERDALLMYTVSETPLADTIYCCVQLEPGDYTLTISMPAICGCPTQLRHELDFTVINPDYATDHMQTNVTVDLSATVDADMPLGFTGDAEESYIENGTEYRNATLVCNQAEGLRGDVHPDGVIDSADAIVTLRAYNAALMQLPAPITEIQAVCADIDGDGSIQPADAIAILRYYNALLMHETPDWNNYIH
ncbi:MAG: hypothetical protein ACI4J3_09200 [Oscillospiraceae bacterium]